MADSLTKTEVRSERPEFKVGDIVHLRFDVMDMVFALSGIEYDANAPFFVIPGIDDAAKSMELSVRFVISEVISISEYIEDCNGKYSFEVKLADNLEGKGLVPVLEKMMEGPPKYEAKGYGRTRKMIRGELPLDRRVRSEHILFVEGSGLHFGSMFD